MNAVRPIPQAAGRCAPRGAAAARAPRRPAGGRLPPALAVGLAGLVALAGRVGPAAATGFTDIGQDIEAHSELELELDGALRLRGALLHNLDLDRGPTPSGELFFPVPPSDPRAQLLTHADMRLRNDLAVYVPAASMAVKLRLDVVDNLALGSAPAGPPVGALGQQPPAVALRVRRAYGEALLPFGLLAAGRMGSHWGLGMLTHGGDCADCDSGDAADRIALITPLAGHVWALAYDFSASGPDAQRRDGRRSIDLDPSDDVRTVTLAVLDFRHPLALQRRRLAGKTTFEYGLYAAYRWQDNDIPASYLPLASEVPIDGGQVMARGLHAVAADLWLRLTHPRFRIEAEAAVIWSRIDQPSLLPGALLHQPLEALQFGAAVESQIGAPEDAWVFGLDGGFASGDPAPGFGAFVEVGAAAPRRGDLQGAQAVPPYDNRLDNFRFHPDYRIDRILFREIVGTVTDAFYLRPHLRWRMLQLGPGRLELALAAVASFAVRTESAPGGERPLGVEIDPSLGWINERGFSVVLDYAALFPLAGLDNPQLGLGAEPAQLARLRVVYAY
jgi:uncharacterized protein (TIGR04551 family)